MSKAPSVKRVAIALPEKRTAPDPEAFVAAGKEALLPPAPAAEPAAPAAKEETKRLTIDIVESLHKRIRRHCVEEDVKMTDLVRQLLEERFPPESKPGG